MFVIAYEARCRPSGRALAEQLRVQKSSINIRQGSARFLRSQSKRLQPTAIINWGSLEVPVSCDILLNPPELVRELSNKRTSRKLFLAKNVPSPKLFPNAGSVTEKDLPVIGRSSYHRQGNHFWFCESLAEVQRAARSGATHFLEYLNSTREYRVHCTLRPGSLGKARADREIEDVRSIKISEKVPAEDNDFSAERILQRNHDFGWVFRAPHRNEEELTQVRRAARAALAATGFDFGAVDVLYSLRDKAAAVLEVNTAPCLTDAQASTAEVYAKSLLEILDART